MNWKLTVNYWSIYTNNSTDYEIGKLLLDHNINIYFS